MMARPTFVLVTPVLPWPPNQGSRQFLLDVARSLLMLGAVHWVTREIGDQSDGRRLLAEEGFQLHLDDEFVPQSLWARLKRRTRIDIGALISGAPRELHFISTPRVESLVRDVVASQPGVIGVGAFWSTWRALRPVPRERRLLLLSDVESDRLSEAQRAGFATGGELARLRRSETEALRSVRYRYALTEHDAHAARELVGEDDGRCERWPVRIEPGPAVEVSDHDGPLRLLAYGHWEAAFNRDGMEEWLRSVWPRLRERDPAPSLRVVGPGIDATLQSRLLAAGIDAVGWVDSLGSEFRSADAVIVSLRYAGGLRYRLLESMAVGMPCIANPVAARGIDARAGSELLVAEGTDEWVAAVASLADPQLRESLGREARSFVKNRFGEAGHMERVRAALAPVLESTS